jgi:hypothetical protein
MRKILRNGISGKIPRCDRCEAINVDLIIKKKELVASIVNSAGGKKVTIAED